MRFLSFAPQRTAALWLEKLTAEPEESKCSKQDADHLRKPEDVSSSQQANDRAIQPQSDSAEIVGGEIEVADWHMGYFQNYLASLEDLGAVSPTFHPEVRNGTWCFLVLTCLVHPEQS